MDRSNQTRFLDGKKKQRMPFNSSKKQNPFAYFKLAQTKLYGNDKKEKYKK